MKKLNEEKKYLIDSEKHISLTTGNETDLDKILKISKALSSPERIRILKALHLRSTTIATLSSELNIPVTSLFRHIDVLADADIIKIHYRPSLKGHLKYCSLKMLSCEISIDEGKTTDKEKQSYTIEMPVGMFSDINVAPPCGMASKNSVIGVIDDEKTFYLPDRYKAEKLWFGEGYISYNFPLNSSYKNYSKMIFSFEVCSETVLYNFDWPSDITIFINDVEITTFTTSGDFGGRHGKYTDSVWAVTSTQYGVLKTLEITENGIFLDNVLIDSNVNFEKLFRKDETLIKFTLAINPDAVHKGGINIFGKNFGDYPQAILLTLIEK